MVSETFHLLIHIPSYPFMNFQNPVSNYLFWVRVTHKILNVNWHKNSLNNFICHFSWLKKPSPDSYTSPQNHSWIFETLWVIFWVRVTHKMLNVNWEKIHSIILSVTCHGLRNFTPFIHIPSYPFMNFQNPVSYYLFWVRVTHKILNVNCIKIHSIILCVTCHGLRNFPLLIHIPSKPFVNFWNPMSYYSELESLIKCWMWIGKKFTQ